MLLSNVDGLSHGSEVRVKVKCDICENVGETSFANYFNSQERRGWPKTTYCRACVCRISAVKRKGKPAHNKGIKLDPSERGVNHARWKGGKYMSSDGYIMVHVGGDKQPIGWNSYKKEHKVVAEEKIGRSLEKHEVVHHIDGQKTNNLKDNLFVTDHSGHRNAHVSLQNIGYELYRIGMIGFDEECGTYFLKEINADS